MLPRALTSVPGGQAAGSVMTRVFFTRSPNKAPSKNATAVERALTEMIGTGGGGNAVVSVSAEHTLAPAAGSRAGSVTWYVFPAG